MKSVPVATLASSGKKIPVLGFGTATYPFTEAKALKESILHAIKVGYRHFDTAAVYQSEEPLGEAIAEALRLGLIKSREELFVTSKLWCSDGHPDRVLPALQQSLKNLGLAYLDLYLIHWPVSAKPDSHEVPIKKENFLPMDVKLVWEAMEACQERGLTRSIGVSNFSCRKLEKLLETAKIPPSMNQVEMNPMWQQQKLRKFCEEKGILVSGYSPLGAIGTSWGSDRVLECQVLKDIAHSKGKTVAQVALRWAHEQGVIVIVKSSNKKRMEENLDIFDWKLSHEELEKISQLPQIKVVQGEDYIYSLGPFKTLEEFWDGEI